ncbi:MAG TPA: YggT family protein [Caulobacterales bacterium]|nr:YggT family protein [Caulobacterales bacterium]
MLQILDLIFSIVNLLLNLLIVVIIVQVVISWLYAFQIVSTREPIVNTVWRFTNVITNPLVRPIRRIIPPVQGFDFAPMVLLLLIYVIQRILPIILYGFR